ncbi:MAG: hypothetical protein KKC79_16335 [Gammaproteobacteria bacterium]|nr:hypothetical protein [Gammaproteobacteria bacterium]MBU1440524.1 hypothetical protein [Gammaproteobacteria bacterium]MBU2288725.1 hypothetical protein [Gammaproteobacteria bacterium]MBU2410204.1 hypothetical protein [Gammaproteobacteria bacterium]
MSYIAVTLNHFRALQEWATQMQAEAHLDVKTFEVTVLWRQGRCVLRPQFLCSINGNFSYATVLGPAATGFIGWLPYRPMRWSMSTDKREFKRYVLGRSMHTPFTWPAADVPERDYVLKQPSGSFGKAVFGPYRGGRARPEVPEVATRDLQTLFAEEFIEGRNLKVWYWGGEPFHAHLHAYPTVCGDGYSTLESLIARRLGREDPTLPHDAERQWILSSLAYQGCALSTVLSSNVKVWIDYRYGRLYGPPTFQAHSDSALSHLTPAVLRQVRLIGSALHRELLGQFGLPMLFAIDGVLDDAGRIWWLEVNSNPVMPPTGYPLMLASVLEQGQMPPFVTSTWPANR